MGDSLLKLMIIKPFENISITEITKMSGVSRMTFYRNFSSKEDVLIYKIGILFDSWIKDNPISSNPDYNKLILNYFKMLLINKDILQILYDSGCLDILQGFLNKLLWYHLSDEDISFRRAFYSYGLYGVTIEWIKGKFIHTPEDMTKIMMDNLNIINISYT